MVVQAVPVGGVFFAPGGCFLLSLVVSMALGSVGGFLSFPGHQDESHPGESYRHWRECDMLAL